MQLLPIMSVFRFTASGCGLSPTTLRSRIRGQMPQETQTAGQNCPAA